MTETSNDIHVAGDIPESTLPSHSLTDDSLDDRSSESSDSLEIENFWSSSRFLWSPLPPLFTTDFLDCSVCNSLSKGGISGTELEEDRELGIDSATRYTLATTDVEFGSHDCPICAFLYEAVCSYASRFQDIDRTYISVVNGLCDHKIRIIDDLRKIPDLKTVVSYPQPSCVPPVFHITCANFSQRRSLVLVRFARTKTSRKNYFH